MRKWVKILILALLTIVSLSVITVAAGQKVKTEPHNAVVNSVGNHDPNLPAVPFAAVHNRDHSHDDHGDDHGAHPADHHNHFAGIDDHDAIAIADMHGAALHHFGIVEEDHDSFGAIEGWSPNWELRYIDYGTPEHTIRVYHATNTHDHSVRYVSIIDPAHGFYEGWQVVH